jgi:hypothetical protein
MKKNVASQVIGAQMVSASDGSAFTGTVTVYVTRAGAQLIGMVGSGVCVHEGNGFHTYAPSQAETNSDHIAFTFVGTGAVPATVQVYTNFPQTGDTFTRIGAPVGASISADLVTIDGIVDAILVDTGTTLEGHLTDIKGATFNTSTDSLEAIRNNHPTNFADMSVELATGKVSITDSDLSNIVAEIDLSSTTIADIQDRIPTISSAAIFESYLDGSEYLPVDPYKIDFSVSGTTLTVRKPNDVTIAYTKTLGTDAGALPVVSSV